MRPLTATITATVALAAVLLGCGDGAVDEASAPLPVASGSAVPESTVSPRLGAAPGLDSATYEYFIPVGAGAAIAAGEPVEILPGSLRANVGETIRIINNDTRGHNVGPWYIGANETLTQQFTSTGSFEGLCSVHSSGAFVLEVVDA